MQDKFRIAAYIFTAITIIIVCIIVALRRSIAVAIRVIKLGSRAMTNVPGVILFPIFSVILLVSLLVRSVRSASQRLDVFCRSFLARVCGNACAAVVVARAGAAPLCLCVYETEKHSASWFGRVMVVTMPGVDCCCFPPPPPPTPPSLCAWLGGPVSAWPDLVGVCGSIPGLGGRHLAEQDPPGLH